MTLSRTAYLPFQNETEPCGSWLSRPDELYKCAPPTYSASKYPYEKEFIYEFCNGTGATKVYTHIPYCYLDLTLFKNSLELI